MHNRSDFDFDVISGPSIRPPPPPPRPTPPARPAGAAPAEPRPANDVESRSEAMTNSARRSGSDSRNSAAIVRATSLRSTDWDFISVRPILDSRSRSSIN